MAINWKRTILAGLAGLHVNVLLPVITLVRHWGFGLVLAGLIPLDQPKPVTKMTNRLPVTTAP
jgi:hypothetical protein